MMIIIKDLAVELAPKYAEQDSPIDAMLTERIRDRLNEIEDDTQVGGRSARHAAAATTGYRALAVRAGGGAYPQGGRPPAGGRDDAQAGGDHDSRTPGPDAGLGGRPGPHRGDPPGIVR